MPTQCAHLSYERAPRCSSNAPTQLHHQEISQKSVDGHRADVRIHSIHRTTRRTQLRIQTIIQMCEGIAKEQNLHISSRVREGVVRSTKQAENRVEIQFKHCAQRKSNHHVEHNDIAQNDVRSLVIFLSQTYAHQRRTANTHHCTESRRNRHQRVGQSQTRNRICTHGLTDEDAVNDVVE